MSYFIVVGLYEEDDAAREVINLDLVTRISVVDKVNNGYRIFFGDGGSVVYTLDPAAFRNVMLARQTSMPDISG